MYTGSRAFFEGMRDFVPSDTDKVVFKNRGANFMLVSKNKETTFYWNENIGKQGIKEHILQSKRYEPFCMFLVPEIAEYLGVTIEDIKELQEYFHLCDAKHQYLATICDAYIKNNDFKLTATQRLEAYNLYRTTRGLPKIDIET